MKRGYTDQNIHKNMNTQTLTIKIHNFKVQQKHTKHSTIYTMMKMEPKNMKKCDKR